MTRRPPRRVEIQPGRWKDLGESCLALTALVVLLVAAARGARR